MKARFITLGCKVNQYETQALREEFARRGIESEKIRDSKSQTQFVVINTCTVTQAADRENLYWVRRARREYPEARIVVTGCGVQRDREIFSGLPEVDEIFLNDEKPLLVERLFEGCASSKTQEDLRKEYPSLEISETDGAARAFVKIQDGCNHACSFCKVVLVRGRSRSRGIQKILDEILRLRDSGYREIVFAGIQLGAYGLDFKGAHSLPLSPLPRLEEVLYEAAKIEGIERLRLSSIEPTDVRPQLIEALHGISKCVPHMHIPLQSGDDTVLRRMNRRYSRSFYLDLIERLRSGWPDFSLTLDVMAGFPGEDEKAFKNTWDTLEKIRPLKCHVFPYSRRAGTRANQWQAPPVATVKRRVKALREISDRMGEEIRISYLGRSREVLIESFDSNTETVTGLTASYFKVRLRGRQDQIGQMIPVTLKAVHGDFIWGEYGFSF